MVVTCGSGSCGNDKSVGQSKGATWHPGGSDSTKIDKSHHATCQVSQPKFDSDGKLEGKLGSKK